MRRNRVWAIAFLCLLNTLLAFGQEPSKPAKAEKKEEPPPPSSLPYEYRSQDKIDPFVPFRSQEKKPVMLPIAGAEGPEAKQEEVSLTSMNELKLSGMVKKGSQTWAVLVGPDGRGLFVREGMKVGKEGALVSSIIYEDRQTPAGLVEVRKVILKVPVSKADGSEEFQEVELSMGASKE